MTDVNWFVFLYMLPLVAWLDYHIFGKYLICDNCGAKPDKWHWVLPCLIEFLFFMCGIVFGLYYKNG